ncbi:efflux RND transporter periplasmic adaptor subunit [Oceanicoccus sagamiensis]|uniref:Multidrug resistance protein MdtA-like barrel-sandwich hybrid domain-containing protein n=1 Tax=Oceanicoccus sagamiensis TaxID=716816 RepID=A0A1X9NEB9_9GAMM|nr:efflux RND transporter periplasmic adaptor subunit [Oceanicoccus sagamiensis]ARN73297.1 hypothetical protein BST96_03750 [Oceanicoccus sagamiensis]
MYKLAKPLLLPFILAVVALLSGCESGEVSPEPYFHQVVAKPAVQVPEYTIDRYFVGQVQARQRAELGFEVAGTIEQVMVDEGDRVSQGQVLAQLDNRLLNAEIAEIEASGDDINARLDLAKLKLKRERELNSKGYAAEQRIDELMAEIASLNAQLMSLKARQASAETMLSKHQLVAPYAGEIAYRYSDSGSIAQPGHIIFRLLEQGQEEARVGVPTRLVSALSVGAPVVIQVAGKDMQAKVMAIATNVDAMTRTSSVRIAMPAVPEAVDGEMVYLHVPERIQQPGFWLTDSSLASGVRGMWNVYVLVPQAGSDLYTIEARSIELLYMADGRAFVKGAINQGEPVISAGLHRVVPGLSVRLSSASSGAQ